jgi:hypothetical protein
LLQLVESFALRGLRSKSVKLHVLRRELGSMARDSRESVNNILQNCHRQKLIDLDKASIVIHDIDAL